MNPWLQSLIAFVVACHGSIYVPLRINGGGN